MFHHGHHASWQRINFRGADSVLTAEFLHGLYARHDPFLNPFRFANTAVVFRPWECESWAPTEEWERLGRRFGDRFLRHPQRTSAELRRLLSSPRSRARELADELVSLPLRRLSDEDLVDVLTRLQHVPLGDIYEVNLVQVEHALHAAVSAVVAQRHGPEAAQCIVAELATSSEPTEASRSDAAFLDLVDDVRKGVLSRPDADQRLEEMTRRHRALGSAYGARTVGTEELATRLDRYLDLDAGAFEAMTSRGLPSRTGGSLPEPFDDLVPLLRLTGEVRDRNKALLGTVTRHRAALLHEVARRTGTAFDAVRLLLLEELIRLVEDRAGLPDEVLSGRLRDGLVLRRSEGFAPATAAPDGVGVRADATHAETLNGLCASAGRHEGTVRIVSSAADLARMGVGDVLVARGTDFDLLMLLRMAGAIVTEEGGLLSHAAVVARELGVPCVIRVPRATAVLRDGERVTVDADAGAVLRAAPEAPVSRPTGSSGPVLDGPLVVRVDDLVDPAHAGRKALGLVRLAGEGLEVPTFRVVPTSVCERLAGPDGGQVARAVAEAIVAAFPGRRLSIRSSSTLEDLDEGTAAGVYHSEVGLPPDADAVEAAVLRVHSSRAADRAAAYHARAGRDHHAPMALLVAPYLEFTHQGVCVSHAPGDPDAVLVEAWESAGDGGCPDGVGELWSFRHVDLAASPVDDAPRIPYLTTALRGLAADTLTLSERMGAPVEVEWGRSEGRLVFLQARVLAAPMAVVP